MDMKTIIVFCSPGGSTRRVAETIQDGFNQRNAAVKLLDLAQMNDRIEGMASIQTANQPFCLFVGSPVYRDLAVEPIMRFIDKLPVFVNAYAVPFVTWGQACSGVALWQMAAALTKKGFAIVGAAKVLAVHTLMWRARNPAGKGHPDETDFQKIQELVANIYDRFQSGNISALSDDILDYQPALRAAEFKKKMKAPKLIVPKNVKAEICTQCGVCQERCPVSAVSLNPYPQFDQNCIDCFNCIRLCPENAIEPARSLDQIEVHIRERVLTIQEQPYTQIFY
jgi:ferredoxin/flavodoxin